MKPEKRKQRSQAVQHAPPELTLPKCSPSSDTSITEIQVTRLFGLYNYSLSPKALSQENSCRLLILYGDNGSGKTTLLRLVTHLLSPEANRGHRTIFASVAFERFAVTIGGHTTVEALRPKGEINGSMTFRITKNGKVSAEAELPMRSGAIQFFKGEDALQEQWDKCLQALRDLHLTAYYLPDDRKAESIEALVDDDSVPLDSRTRHQLLQHLRGEVRRVEQVPILESAIGRAVEWIRQEALKATNTGEADTNKVYSDIVKRIARSGTRNVGTDQMTTLTNDLVEIQARIRGYSALGLVSPLDATEILSTLERVKAAKKQIIVEILRPYVDGIIARLRALENVQHLVQVFLDSINSFFTNKTVSFDLAQGLTFRSKNGTDLPASLLSSGEKQLLLLFCNTVTARQSATLFIIDEPEISLNVKWQRRLMGALLSLVRGTPVQFLIATHSIELLTQYSGNVLTLRDEGAA